MLLHLSLQAFVFINASYKYSAGLMDFETVLAVFSGVMLCKVAIN